MRSRACLDTSTTPFPNERQRCRSRRLRPGQPRSLELAYLNPQLLNCKTEATPSHGWKRGDKSLRINEQRGAARVRPGRPVGELHTRRACFGADMRFRPATLPGDKTSVKR